jgi:hypothetical protein
LWWQLMPECGLFVYHNNNSTSGLMTSPLLPSPKFSQLRHATYTYIASYEYIYIIYVCMYIYIYMMQCKYINIYI